jgi:hypothetical protein
MRGRSLLAESFVGISTSITWRPFGASIRLGSMIVSFIFKSEAVTKPAQRQSRGLRYTHHMPAPGNGMAKGMQPASRIQNRSIGCCEHDPGCSDGCTHHSRPDNSHSNRACRLVTGSSHDGRSVLKTSLFRTAGRNFSAHLMRFRKGRKQVLVDSCSSQHFPRPPSMGNVKQKSSRSVGHIDRTLAS